MTTANPMSAVMDSWMAGYKTMTWNQDQMETLGASWLEQARSMRNDGQKVLEVMVAQAKNSTDELARTNQALVKNALESVPAWDVLTQADLRRQVADLGARLDAQAKS
ncbi:MAG: hypothetical protein JWM80_3703 [Cyanobacteria bacterium RYN_339]|nr:hypothetical protein [Cyanobacteria bacterium RYN_339]